jgi:hypothetical protein
MSTHIDNPTVNRRTPGTRRCASVLGISSVGLVLLTLVLCTVLSIERADSKEPVQVAIRPASAALASAALGLDDKSPPGTGTFKGVVTFKGTPPAPKLVHKKDDPKIEKPEDRAVCAAADYYSEEFLVNEKADNGVANVLVYIEKTPAGYTPGPVPEEPAVFDQKGCRFIPHVMVLRCNQKLLIKSGDPVVHNTNITAVIRNTGFNQTISANDREGVPFTYKKPEGRPVPVKCDLHPFMKAYHLPLEHSLAAVTDDEGKFEIKGVPPGKHTFVIWHETCGYLNRKHEVEIKADNVTEAKLSYGADKFFKQ